MTILYHYCSNDAFHSIIENRRIWLSSLSLSNDSMEGKLVAEILARIAKADGLDQAAMHRLQESVSGLEQVIDGLGYCLSENGDLLSQWRGYAADATGVSIGFSKDYLEQCAEASRASEKSGFTLQRVEYDLEIQESLIKPTYIKIKELINEGAFKLPGKRSLLDARSDDEVKRDNNKIKDAFSRLSITLLSLFAKLFLLKTSAFREEREWRLISYFVKTGDDTCSFRALNERIVPFREFELLESESGSIVEVILGPKNTTPNYVIESFLKQSGFANVNILRSEATYR
ncbi:MAG: DUF2971 domain-containing protein [Desulfobaccales bacterium]